MKKTQKKTPLFVQILVIAVIFAVGFGAFGAVAEKGEEQPGRRN